MTSSKTLRFLLLATLAAGHVAADAALPATDSTLLAAVPDDAFAVVRIADPPALVRRAEENEWIGALASPAGEHALAALAAGFEDATGTDFDGLVALALELEGEALLFATERVAGFLAHPPADPAALAAAVRDWMPAGPRRVVETPSVPVTLVAWPAAPHSAKDRAGHFLGAFAHERAIGLFSGDDVDAVLASIGECFARLDARAPNAPVVDAFLSAGGATTRGVAAYVDFGPFVAEAERRLRDAVAGWLPDPGGLLGLERGTSLFATTDVLPGVRIEADARLAIPPGTLAARLADTFGALPRSVTDEMPRGAWYATALSWDLASFYRTAREGLESVDEDGLARVDQTARMAGSAIGVDPVADVVEELAGTFTLCHLLDLRTGLPGSQLAFALGMHLVDGPRFVAALGRASGGLGLASVELEGARAFLVEPRDPTPGDEPNEPVDTEPVDGGFAVGRERLIASLQRAALARSLRASAGNEDATLARSSPLRAAFDENAGACAFGFVELGHLAETTFAGGLPLVPPSPAAGSRLVVSAHRDPAGFTARLYTR